MEYFDFGITLAFILVILSTIISVIYGILKWNKDAYVQPPKYVKDWLRDEEKLEGEL